MEKLENSKLLYCRVGWKIGVKTDNYGDVFLGNNDVYPYIISVGLGSTSEECYISKVFRNAYNLWYAEIRKQDNTVAQSVTLNLMIFYATE